MTEFCPEYTAMPTAAGRYIGCYRFMTTDGWKYVQKNGTAALFDTFGQARAAAVAHAKQLMNRDIKGGPIAPKRRDLVWKAREDRLNEQAARQIETFGEVIVKGRAVKVEKRGRNGKIAL